MRELLGAAVREARTDLDAHVRPRDEFERAVVNALGEISWDEAIDAITKHRTASPTTGDA